MGRVFTPEQIIQGEIPEPYHHRLAGHYVLGAFFDNLDIQTPYAGTVWDAIEEDGLNASRPRLFDAQLIDSAMVYGSTVEGTSNRRSDVDVLVVYASTHAVQALTRIGEVFSQAEKRYYTPIEAHIRPNFATGGKETIDQLFQQHLMEVQHRENPRWSHNWPAYEVSFFSLQESLSQDVVHEVALNYLAAKSRYFAKALTEYRGEVDYKVLQRAFELPKSLARKVLAATVAVEAETESMSQETVMQLRLAEAARKSIWLTFDPELSTMHQVDLLDMDQEYDEKLSGVLDEGKPVQDYANWIKRNYLSALQKALLATHTWQSVVRNNRDRTGDDGTFLEDGQGVLDLNLPANIFDGDEMY